MPAKSYVIALEEHYQDAELKAIGGLGRPSGLPPSGSTSFL